MLSKRNQVLAKLGAPDKLQPAYDRARDLAFDYKVDAETSANAARCGPDGPGARGAGTRSGMDRAVALLAKVPADRFEFTWDTPIGTITLNGIQDNVYNAGPYLLIIDTGGNDRYASGGATAVGRSAHFAPARFGR